MILSLDNKHPIKGSSHERFEFAATSSSHGVCPSACGHVHHVCKTFADTSVAFASQLRFFVVYKHERAFIMNNPPQFLVLGFFVLTYALLFALPKWRVHVALAAAAILIATGVMPPMVAWFAIDWNVILLIAGMMGIVGMFITSKMPELLGDLIITRVPNIRWAIVILSIFAGIVSAFVDNLATVLIIAPVAFDIAKRQNTSPVPIIFSIALASNLQGAATLVGDTTSILLAAEAKMNFLDFFVYEGHPSLFWVVQISFLCASAFLYFYFNKENQRVEATVNAKVSDYLPTYLLLASIVLLASVSFIPPDKKPEISNGLVCCFLFAIGLIRDCIKSHGLSPVKKAFSPKEMDYETLLLLTGLFVIVGALSETGIIRSISELFVRVSGDSVFIIYTLIVWCSVLLSSFMGNIPYVAAMLPVTTTISTLMNISPTILYFGLLCGATLGGNLNIFGSPAFISAQGMLRRENCEFTLKDFTRICYPYTIIAVVSGYVLVWAIYS